MWSGRFCTALKLDQAGEETVGVTLPHDFYDDVFVLVASGDSFQNGYSPPVVLDTSPAGAKIQYPNGAIPQAGSLHLCCFDGSGGCLYGSVKE